MSTRLMTTGGVAEMLHLHENTVRRWASKGIISSYRIGPRGDRRFMKAEVLKALVNGEIKEKEG